MKYRNAFASMFAAALLALTIGSTSTAHAQVTPSKDHYEAQQSGAVYCEETGWINWTGIITVKLHTVTDANGGYHHEFFADFSKVDGTDADGNRYQGSGRQTTRFNNPAGDGFEQTDSYSYRLVGKNGLGVTCTGTLRLVMNANGEMTVSISEPTVCECK